MALDYEERGDAMNNFRGRCVFNHDYRPAYELGALDDARAHYAEMTKLKPPVMIGEDEGEIPDFDPLDDIRNEVPKDADGKPLAA